jgi:hypothetical protein
MSRRKLPTSRPSYERKKEWSGGFISRVSVVRSHPPLLDLGVLIALPAASTPCKTRGLGLVCFFIFKACLPTS